MADSELLDGKNSGDFQEKYTRTVVSAVGMPTQNGQALQGALAGITGTSQSNPYLLKIEPGHYDLGSCNLPIKESVDVEGSGEQVTRLTSAIESDAGTKSGASNVELRFLTVENTSASGAASGAATGATSGSPLRLTHVTTHGGLARVMNIDSSATIRDSVIEGSAYGIVNQGVLYTIHEHTHAHARLLPTSPERS